MCHTFCLSEARFSWRTASFQERGLYFNLSPECLALYHSRCLCGGQAWLSGGASVQNETFQRRPSKCCQSAHGEVTVSILHIPASYSTRHVSSVCHGEGKQKATYSPEVQTREMGHSSRCPADLSCVCLFLLQRGPLRERWTWDTREPGGH